MGPSIMSLSPHHINSANQIDDDFAATMSGYPFAEWSAFEDDPQLHKVLQDLVKQVKYKFLFRGHRHASALMHAMYCLSLCASFARDGAA